MQFEELKNRFSKLSNLPIPGEAAQFEMAPERRLRELDTRAIKKRDPRWAGVLALFYASAENEAMLVLILRRTYKGVHSNQVGFPGGKAETEDLDIEATALRETEEEIGVDRKVIQVVKKMTKIYIPPSNFWVQPFMSFTENIPTFVPETAEVAAVLEITVDEFLSAEALITQKITTSYASDIEVPAFMLKGHVVWGATAMMLNEIKVILAQAK